jgi:hypothetical protein
MPELTQAEADALLSLSKYVDGQGPFQAPIPGGKLSVPLISADKAERFTLDFWRASIRLDKRTYGHRARTAMTLARLDFGIPHTNPDGKAVGSPHLHVYREGYGAKWAVELPKALFPDLSDPEGVYRGFLSYCNILEAPTIQGNLF